MYVDGADELELAAGVGKLYMAGRLSVSLAQQLVHDDSASLSAGLLSLEFLLINPAPSLSPLPPDAGSRSNELEE